MKKMLTMLTSLSLIATLISSIISCNHSDNLPKTTDNKEDEMFESIEMNVF